MQRYARIALVLAAALSLVMALLPHPPRLPGDPSDKLQHMMAFAVMGAVAAAAFPVRSITAIVVRLGLFGALIEALQAIPALNRDSSVLDLLADIAAALVAVWLTRRILR